MRRNQVIYNRKLSHNIKGWPGYHISKRGRLYKYYPKRGLWMFMKGTISRNRTYHILRRCDKRIRVQGKIPISKSQIRELNEDYQSGYSLRQLSEKYHITHVHRYLYPDTKLRRK